MSSSRPANADDLPHATSPSEASLRTRWKLPLAAGVLVVAGVAAYANSFWGSLIFDDLSAITNNPSIRHLGAICKVLSPPQDGSTVSGRPLLNLSLAINYAISGEQTWSYHVTNLLIHLVNGLLLLGILRRTFQMPVLKPRLGEAGDGLSLAIALIWVLHPLQTESVTYIAQRAESLAALFYLGTLYAVIRGGHSRRAWRWYGAAVGACSMGMASKEIVATAPLVVLLYDGLFLAGSWGETFRRRWGLYVGLASSWALLALLVLPRGIELEAQDGVIPGVWPYARSQPGIILYYLRLSLWPHPLCLDYGWPIAETWRAIGPAALTMGVLVAWTAWGVARRKVWSFLGAWFLGILVPTSSIVPLRQLAFEHRLYLSLAAVVTGVVVGGYLVMEGAARRGWLRHRSVVMVGLVAVVAVMLGSLTFCRNKAYHSLLSVWSDTVRKATLNARAHFNYGGALAYEHRFSEAIDEYLETVRLDPAYVLAHHNLGHALSAVGRHAEAISHLQKVIQLAPADTSAYNALGLALVGQQRVHEAIEQYQEALRIEPDNVQAHNNMGVALADAGRTEQALEHYREALRIDPANAEAQSNWGNLLLGTNRPAEAIAHYREALRLNPDYAEAHSNWGLAIVNSGSYQEAIEHCQEAIRLKPDYAEAHSNLGFALACSGRPQEAIECYREALRLRPDYAKAQFNWGAALDRLGRPHEAMEHYEASLRIRPDVAQVHYNMGVTLATLGQIPAAIDHYRQALRLKPDFAEAHVNLCSCLTQTGQLREAIEHGKQAARLMPNQPQIHRSVAWLLAPLRARPSATISSRLWNWPSEPPRPPGDAMSSSWTPWAQPMRRPDGLTKRWLWPTRPGVWRRRPVRAPLPRKFTCDSSSTAITPPTVSRQPRPPITVIKNLSENPPWTLASPLETRCQTVYG